MYILHVQKKWAALSCKKFKQVCVSIAQYKEREIIGTWCFFFMCLIDKNKFFEIHLLPLKNV